MSSMMDQPPEQAVLLETTAPLIIYQWQNLVYENFLKNCDTDRRLQPPTYPDRYS